MIIYPNVHRLLDSDILGYNDLSPDWWIKAEYKREPWKRQWKSIRGYHIRMKWFGICFYYGPGSYVQPSINWGPFHFLIYKLDQYQHWLESWMGY